MKVIVGTKEEVVKKAAGRYVELLNRKPEAVLGLATGSTPLDLYAELARLCAEGRLSLADVCAGSVVDAGTGAGSVASGVPAATPAGTGFSAAIGIVPAGGSDR